MKFFGRFSDYLRRKHEIRIINEAEWLAFNQYQNISKGKDETAANAWTAIRKLRVILERQHDAYREF